MIEGIRDWIRARGGSDFGGTAVEYAIMLAGVALAIFLAVTAFGIAVRGLFERVPSF